MTGLKVKDVMRTRNLVSVRPDDDVALAAQVFAWARARHLPVVDPETSAVVGVFTERDLLRYRAETRGSGGLDPVSRFMTKPAQTIGPDEPAARAAHLLLEHRIGCLPVVDGGTLVGIVTTTDLLGSQARGPAPGAGEQPKVEIAMRRQPPTVPPHAPLLEAVGLMVDRDVGHVVVLGEDGGVVGIVSDGDVRTAIGDPVEALRVEFEEVEQLTVASVMTTNPVTVRESDGLLDVAREFIDHRVEAIPVLSANGGLTGLVSYVDVLRALRTHAAGGGWTAA